MSNSEKKKGVPEHPENIKLPEKACDNCDRESVCGALGSLIPWINRNMSFFNKTKLPSGVNPTIVSGLQRTLANHCLYYKRKTNVLS